MEMKTPSPIQIVKKSTYYNMVVTEKVENKIRYICQQLPTVEWSGVLFYTTQGSFKDNNLKVICQDIYLMDVGSAAYTEFNMSPEVISYMTENPELLDYQSGLIHSHNQMATFFSGTDVATLKEEGTDRNHFVSLIVNNEGTYTAAITRKISITRNVDEEIQYDSFNGEKVTENSSYVEEDNEFEYFPLKITIEGEKEENKILKARLEEIKKNKNKTSIKISPNSKQLSIPYNPPYCYPTTPNHTSPSNTTSNYKVNSPSPYYSIDADDFTNIDYNKVKLSDKLLKELTLQIITGSILIPNSSKINMFEWSKNMTALFQRRFGEDNYGFKIFDTWAENHIEFICWYTEVEELVMAGYTDDQMASIIAKNLIGELKKLSTNIYINKFINILQKYIV